VRRRARGLMGWLIACYVFLYAPIVFLIALSFNNARLVTAWTGFSTRWYAALWQDQSLIEAASLSLRVAAMSATLALARFPGFPGQALFRASLAAPLVMPEVVTGLSLLLLFVALGQTVGWPARRGALTVTLAHASVAVAYIAVVVRARLADTPPELERAAMDLYAPPWRAFTLVTVPLLAPALVSGWLLAFTLSLDDVVVASFTTGPGASTLPMVVFSSVRLGPTPELYALATVIVGLVSAMLLGGWGLWHGRPSRQKPLVG
jgi:putrescine transport system permease protein